MKISEMIKLLQNHKRTHGDLECFVFEHDELASAELAVYRDWKDDRKLAGVVFCDHDTQFELENA